MFLLQDATELSEKKAGLRKLKSLFADRPKDWARLKPVLPLLVFSSVAFTEMAAFRLWLDGRLLTASGVFRLTIAFLFPPLAVVAAATIEFLFSLIPGFDKQTPRSIRLEEKRITLGGFKNASWLRWASVHRWFVAPVPGQPDAVTLTLETAHPRKPIRGYWSIRLRHWSEVHDLKSELEYVRQRGHSSAPVLELSAPMPKRPVSFCGFWATVLAVYLFLHALPLIGIGLLSDHRNSREGVREHQLGPSERAQFERILVPVFRVLRISDMTDLRTAFLLGGGAMVVTAIGLNVWAASCRRVEQTEFDRAYDQQLEAITVRSPAS